MASVALLRAGILHMSQRSVLARRQTVRFVVPLHNPDRPLTSEEFTALTGRVESLVSDSPDEARRLLRELNNPSADEALASKFLDAPRSALGKVADAKKSREEGRGKTQLFAYLSVVDKARVLELSGAEGAADILRNNSGKTAFFASLPGELKYTALRAWQKDREESMETKGDAGPAPNIELAKLALANGAPMIGFGFVDNFLMITFGEAIDANFGAYVSTMAAAGLGNLCSNMAGLGLADYIEHASERMGLPRASLSSAQRQTPAARASGVLGTMVGVTVGCLLGMVPLLFIPEQDTKKE